MNYTLDSYNNFDEEQDLLATEAKKKADLEQREEIEKREIDYRIKCISGYFLRLSWNHKKQFLLSIIKNINCFNTLQRLIHYIGCFYGKMATYIDVSPYCKLVSEQIVIDHDRSIESSCLKENSCEDLNWISTLSYHRQMLLVLSLLALAGGGLERKIYLHIVNIYNKKLAEKESENTVLKLADLEEQLTEPDIDDTGKYPQDHRLSIEVEKLRKKWDETITKYQKDVFGIDNKKTAKKEKKKIPDKGKTKTKDKGTKKSLKSQKKHGKATVESIDWIQMLPVWIVKKILNNFDNKTLQTYKKVNHYWSYVCDNLIKDRQARTFLNESLDKMIAKLDGKEISRQSAECHGQNAEGPRGKRLNQLLNRGAVKKELRPNVKKSSQVRDSLLTGLPKLKNVCDPLHKVSVYPRLIKEDLLLYKNYQCILKDVNILIDVSESVKKQRDTLSYNLSQQLSDTFSMSGADLADW